MAMLARSGCGFRSDNVKRLSQAKFSRNASSDPRLVLSIRHIEHPMTRVLDAPVAPYGARQPLHVHGQAADVVADLDGLLAVAEAQRRRHRDRLQRLP